MSPLILFSSPESGHAHRVELLLSMLELDYELRDVDLMAGHHRTDEFRAMNPWGQIPVLVDGSIIIRESNAILVYLARRQNSSTWLPSEPARLAEVESWLAKAAGELAYGICAARLILKFGRPGDLAFAQKLGEKFLIVTDSFLSGSRFVAGEAATIGDLAIYSYAALSPEAAIPLDRYANVRRWIADVEALTRFVPLRRLEAKLYPLVGSGNSQETL